MSENAVNDKETIPARFRKTKTGKWAVMAPITDLEKSLADGGKVDVLKKSGDWSTFQVASLGRPFDVDGVEMCYGYGPGDEAEGGGDGTSASAAGGQGAPPRRQSPKRPAQQAPQRDDSEPLPEYQGGAEDEWNNEF